MEYYDVHIGGLTRSLPIVPISDKVSIASFDIFGDTDLIEPCAKEMAKKLPIDNIDYIMTAEAKSIPFVYELAKQLKMPKYFIARKHTKKYMANPIVTEVNSITDDRKQVLVLDEHDQVLIKGKRIALIDDVISTGASIEALETLVKKSGGTVTARAAILAEGDAADREDVIYLDKIPLFFND